MRKSFRFRLFAIIFAISIMAVAKGYALPSKIIMRDGRITEVTISQISSNKIVYTPKNNKKQLIEVDLKDVYMYYTDALGNTYITPDGRKFTGEKTPVDKNLDVIYLVNGKEIGAFDIQRDLDKITYVTRENVTREKVAIKKKYDEVPHTLLETDVFMILYRNGMSEIVTPFIGQEEAVVAADTEPQVVETVVPQYKVIFHDVKKGDTLNSISKRYDVSCDDIIKWNDLPENTRSNAQLKIGSQLMIYVIITE